MPPIHTARLTLRELAIDDAPFILELLNTPGWLHFIGDRGVRNEAHARDYIEKGPLAMYAQEGFGLWRVALRDSDTPIGICGLIKRDSLEDVDIGYGFLPQHAGLGYAYEAAQTALAYGWQRGLRRIVGITGPDNQRSTRLLERLGLVLEQQLVLPGEAETTLLFAMAAPA